jgi:hypothetical protein
MTKMRIAAVGVLLVAGCLTGCFERKPMIPGYYWDGDKLYNSSGVEVASVVTMPFNVDPSQDCIFAASGIESSCTYWETGQEAFDHVGKVFLKGR